MLRDPAHLLFTGIAAFVVLASCAHAQERKPLAPGQWPTSVESVVKDLLGSLSDKDKEVVRNTEREDLIKFHLGWGMGIRNYYGLWRGNDALVRDACGRPCHPDDASMIIIEAVWRELRK